MCSEYNFPTYLLIPILAFLTNNLFEAKSSTEISTLSLPFSIKYPPQTVDISYGRINDGELGWQYYPISTPGKSNGSTASELFPISDNLDFFVYPNPASEQINIHFSGDWIEKRKIIIRICDLNGQVLTEQLVKREQLMNTGIHNISIAEFSNGFKYCGIVFVQVITDDLTQVKRLLIVQ